MVALAFGLAAASFFPVILMGVFDRRANRAGAIAGMLTGLVFTLAYIIGEKWLGMPPWLFGISAQGIGIVGMVFNFVVAFVVSRVTPPPPAHIQQLVGDLRIPAHPGPAVILDEATK